MGALDLEAVKKKKKKRKEGKKWKEILQYVKVRNLENSDNIWQLHHSEWLLKKRDKLNFRALISQLIGGLNRNPLPKKTTYVVQERSSKNESSGFVNNFSTLSKSAVANLLACRYRYTCVYSLAFNT